MNVSGRDLKIFFRGKGITQDELAEKYKTTRQTISIYLNKVSPPDEFVKFAIEMYGFSFSGSSDRKLGLGDDIKEFLRRKKITQEEVAEAFGVKRQSINSYLKKTPTPVDFLDFMKSNYGYSEPGIGEGNAFEVGSLSGGEIEYSKSGNEFVPLGNGQFLMIVPLVEDYAQAGYTAGFSDTEFINELPRHSIVVTQKHKGKYRAFRVSGDSMNDDTAKAICDGDIATGREIEKIHWNSRFHLHKFTEYIIVHREGIIIKTIVQHNVEQGIIKCQSKNSDKERYPDFDINLKDVFEILNVVAIDRPWK
jgi:transcriptional regulator with XRE-family HTH domain